MEPVAEFRSPLMAQVVDDSTDILATPLIFYSAILKREIVVPAGFQTDYASVPRLPFAYWLAGGVAKKAAVIHDYLYRSAESTRAEADAVFREAMSVTGTSWWRRYPMWLGVRLFGGLNYKSPNTLDPTDYPEGGA